MPAFVAGGQEVLLPVESLEDEHFSRHLVIIPAKGGEPIRIDDQLVERGYVKDFAVTPDGSTVLYTATAHDHRVEELFAAPLQLHWSRNQVGLWSDSGNWGPNSDEAGQFTPMRATSVVIDGGGEVTVPATVRHIDIARLTVGGDESSESVLRTGEGGTWMSIARDAAICPAGRLLLEGGTLGVEGDFTNEGIIDVVGGGGISGGRIQNAASGSILIAHDETLYYSGDHILNAGHITLTPSATLQASGTWEGRGTHGAGQVIVRGELLPGIGIGEQSFGGDLVLEGLVPESESRVTMEIAGTRAGREHDLLRARGTFTFAGHLDVLLIDGGSGAFEPSVGHTFAIVDAQGGIDGRFTSIAMPSSNWAIHYDETTIRLEVLDPSGRGDYNGDGRIDQSDLDLTLLSWGDAPNDHRLSAQWTHYVPVGVIGQAELDGLLLGWGRSHQHRSISKPRAIRATPEPSAALLVMLSAFTAALYGRRSCAR